MDPFFLLKIQILLAEKSKRSANTFWKLTDRIKEFTYIFANFGQIFMLKKPSTF